jgi:hypothetical protein
MDTDSVTDLRSPQKNWQHDRQNYHLQSLSLTLCLLTSFYAPTSIHRQTLLYLSEWHYSVVKRGWKNKIKNENCFNKGMTLHHWWKKLKNDGKNVSINQVYYYAREKFALTRTEWCMKFLFTEQNEVNSIAI